MFFEANSAAQRVQKNSYVIGQKKLSGWVSILASLPFSKMEKLFTKLARKIGNSDVYGIDKIESRISRIVVITDEKRKFSN